SEKDIRHHHGKGLLEIHVINKLFNRRSVIVKNDMTLLSTDQVSSFLRDKRSVENSHESSSFPFSSQEIFDVIVRSIDVIINEDVGKISKSPMKINVVSYSSSIV